MPAGAGASQTHVYSMPSAAGQDLRHASPSAGQGPAGRCPPSREPGSGRGTPSLTMKAGGVLSKVFTRVLPQLRSQVHVRGLPLHSSLPVAGPDTGSHGPLPTQGTSFQFGRHRGGGSAALGPTPRSRHLPVGGENTHPLCRLLPLLHRLSWGGRPSRVASGRNQKQKHADALFSGSLRRKEVKSASVWAS